MTNDEFRALETLQASGWADGGKADDLLSAAVTAFTGITRPARSEIQQLEDLALPLLENATPRGKRHVAAVLSQLDTAPRKLVLALCGEAVEIAAPLLLRSSVLTSNDLVEIIGKHGLAHARAIARRPELDGIVGSVLESFADPVIDRSMEVRRRLGETDTSDVIARRPPLPCRGRLAGTNDGAYLATSAIGESRTDSAISPLVGEMSGRTEGGIVPPTLPSESELTQRPDQAPSPADSMIDTALLIDPVFFRNMLADRLGVSFEQAQAIIGQWPDSRLPIALKALGLSAQDCYLIMTAVLGPISSDRHSLRDFVYFYRSIDRETALHLVRRGKAGEMTALLRQKLREMAAENDEPVLDAANSDGITAFKAAR
ncbi:hypothetical protein GCM10011491_41090 [Brucella endophytica]|uniref:DUF2336 domain-containing protein n=1 Tax=Brucella endophytica TaxID=1963359 RepID=A0A916WKH8_9HYPH|nr:DUF2336 domain-containing protein [Brucella endophytica]GGB08880.1 hypothetical protein GCM10011491_41090 [Brucella endophytica]